MKYISAVLLFLISSSAIASTTAKIDKILFYEEGNLIYIYPKGGVQNPPACHGSNGDYISYKMSRPMAQAYLTGLMTAFAAQRTVWFRTAGDCIDQSNSDTLVYFQVLSN